MKVLFLLLIVAFGLGGCATTQQSSDESAVSAIPWNRPEKWEGQGPFGGLVPGGY
jgi:hypothetical protein